MTKLTAFMFVLYHRS